MPARPRRLVALATLAVATTATLYPIVWMLSASFEPKGATFKTRILDLTGASFASYASAFTERPSFSISSTRSSRRACPFS